MENATDIGFIGAGNMAYALINGLLNNGYDSKNIKASDPNDGLFAVLLFDRYAGGDKVTELVSG